MVNSTLPRNHTQHLPNRNNRRNNINPNHQRITKLRQLRITSHNTPNHNLSHNSGITGLRKHTITSISRPRQHSQQRTITHPHQRHTKHHISRPNGHHQRITSVNRITLRPPIIRRPSQLTIRSNTNRRPKHRIKPPPQTVSNGRPRRHRQRTRRVNVKVNRHLNKFLNHNVRQRLNINLIHLTVKRHHINTVSQTNQNRRRVHKQVNTHNLRRLRHTRRIHLSVNTQHISKVTRTHLHNRISRHIKPFNHRRVNRRTQHLSHPTRSTRLQIQNRPHLTYNFRHQIMVIIITIRTSSPPTLIRRPPQRIRSSRSHQPNSRHHTRRSTPGESQIGALPTASTESNSVQLIVVESTQTLGSTESQAANRL